MERAKIEKQHRCLWLIALFLLVENAGAQTPPRCPTGAPLTLLQVVGEIKNHVPEGRIAELIASCHVSFTLSPTALERLVAAGAPSRLMDTLDRDTISRLSLSQAKAEVAALEQGIVQNEGVVNRERDEAIRKVDADFLRKKSSASNIEPRGPFEKTIDYEVRKRNAQDAVESLERQLGQEKSALTERAAANLDIRNTAARKRINALKAGRYVIPPGPIYTSYDPDTERLVATIAGEEHWFSAPPERAKELVGHWALVKLQQHFEDDEDKTRFLYDVPSAAVVSGLARRVVERKQLDAKVATQMRSARTCMERKDYRCAINGFQQAVDLDGSNQAARDALESAGKAEKTQAEIKDWLAEARQLDAKKEYVGALAAFRKAAEAGSTEGLREVGEHYRDSQGVATDFAEAKRWLILASDHNDATAIAEVGMLYQDGKGVRQDYQEAMRWYRRSANSDGALGMNQVGVLYARGYSVKQDAREAMTWFRKAAEKGLARAMANVASIYYSGGVGVPQDYVEAMRWFKKSADAGLIVSMVDVGNLYSGGKGTPQDYAEALRWFRKAADAGSAAAFNELGTCYYFGKGVAVDYREAMTWYKKAAEAGSVVAAGSVGWLYEKGQGVPKDAPEALKWYLHAAEKGDRSGMYLAGSLYERGEGVQKNLFQAIEWYKKAEALADKRAIDRLRVLGIVGR